MSEGSTVPRITAVTKTKNPNRVAQGKKLAAIRAEKRRMREVEAQDLETADRPTDSDRSQPHNEDNEDDDGYRKMTFYLALVSSVAALISIPFVYRYLIGTEVTSDPPATAVMTNRTTQDRPSGSAASPHVQTTPDKRPKKGPPPDMIEFD
jgi:hypothetical protein